MFNRQIERSHFEIENQKRGWDLFSEETAWFVYDFFKYYLSPYDKLIFYGYYIMGFTLMELGERLHCSHQNVANKIERINKSIKKFWEKKDDSYKRD